MLINKELEGTFTKRVDYDEAIKKDKIVKVEEVKKIVEEEKE